MQHATTISTSLIVMLIDTTQGCASVYDVYQRFQPIKQFISKLPVDHPIHGKSFLEVAIALDQDGYNISRGKQSSCSTLSGPPLQTNSVTKPKESKTGLKASNKVFVLSHEATSQTTDSNTYMPANLCSSENQVAFLDATRKLLFATKFVILVEYTEVIMPVFYSLIMVATYYLPNRAFYSTIADIDEQNLWSMITSVLMYAALELISLILMDLVIRFITGVSAMRQVGFVLSTQSTIVQSKLLSWVLYAVQISLEHYGTDYSFQFKWLHSN